LEQFWQKAKTNLQAGRVRMVFVADEIPSELQRIVEFLNGQMDPAEVLAVEIKQYVGRGLQTLVPRVLSQTVEAIIKKTGRQINKWDKASFFKVLEEGTSTEEVKVAKNIYDWAKARQLQEWWGEGKLKGSFIPLIEHNGTEHTLIALGTSGSVQMQFQFMSPKYHNTKPFDDEAKRLELLHKLNEIPGISIPDKLINDRPSFSLSNLKDEVNLKQFFETLEWAINEIKTS
jgi:hypothetical protein